jgi:hypothetical protein
MSVDLGPRRLLSEIGLCASTVKRRSGVDLPPHHRLPRLITDRVKYCARQPMLPCTCQKGEVEMKARTQRCPGTRDRLEQADRRRLCNSLGRIPPPSRVPLAFRPHDRPNHWEGRFIGSFEERKVVRWNSSSAGCFKVVRKQS